MITRPCHVFLENVQDAHQSRDFHEIYLSRSLSKRSRPACKRLLRNTILKEETAVTYNTSSERERVTTRSPPGKFCYTAVRIGDHVSHRCFLLVYGAMMHIPTLASACDYYHRRWAPATRYFCEHLGKESHRRWEPHAEAEGVCKSVSKSELSKAPFPPGFKVLFYGNSHLRQVKGWLWFCFNSFFPRSFPRK